MIVRTPEERADLVEAGKRLGVILKKVADAVAPGVATKELDALAERLIREGGDVPVLLGYTPDGSRRPYPATLCVSVNDEVVHGIPTENSRMLAEGDIVSLDLALSHNGRIADAAMTVPAGESDAASYKLMDATRAALEAGIAAARVGGHIGDISAAIEGVIEEAKFAPVWALGGHGVGSAVHEEPYIGNTGHAGTGEEIVDGMVLALEPIANAGKAAVVLAPDGYTYRTKDGSRSAHFEHTILIEKGGTTVLTRSS